MKTEEVYFQTIEPYFPKPHRYLARNLEEFVFLCYEMDKFYKEILSPKVFGELYNNMAYETYIREALTNINSNIFNFELVDYYWNSLIEELPFKFSKKKLW